MSFFVSESQVDAIVLLVMVIGMVLYLVKKDVVPLAFCWGMVIVAYFWFYVIEPLLDRITGTMNVLFLAAIAGVVLVERQRNRRKRI